MVQARPASREDRRSICIASCTFDSLDDDPEALLTRYHAMTGWARALVDAGAGVVNVVQRCRRDAVIHRDGVDFHFVADDASPQPPPWFWGSRMARVVERLRPRVVHVDGLIFPMVVRHLRLRLPGRVAILVQDHGGVHAGSFAFRTRRGRAFYRLGLGGADGFLFTAADQAGPWRRCGIIEGRHPVYEVVEASTDLASMPRRMDHGRPLPGAPALLWVGRLDPNKDPLTVLDGFERIAAARPNASLTMVYGDDLLLSAVKARIVQSAILQTQVHLLGKVERSALPRLYAAADIFVLGSHREVACFSLLEALSFGVVPVVTDIPAFRAITDAGRLGGLFAPGHTQAFVRAVESLCDDSLHARRESVRAYFERELSWSAVGRKALAIYEVAVERRASWPR